MSKKTLKFDFSNEDIEATLAALPLVSDYGADTAEQAEINRQLSMLVSQKLIKRSENFNANEFRIIYASLYLAKEYLSGHIDLDVSPEKKAELKKHFFTYNKLVNAFGPEFDRLCNSIGLR